ncbi:MAG: hypothetical protein AAGG48_08950 [Planctomycetota bacterium]
MIRPSSSVLLIMPRNFESFGIQFLYPDNWKQVERADDEGTEGVTLELPSGGFFTVERARDDDLAEEVVDQMAQTFESDYDEVESERVDLPGLSDREAAMEFRFYYLDLLVVSRLIVLDLDGGTVVVQMQAESRDFDENELVFDALIKQIRQLV